jgi:esterase/lipase superfamily enzyme
MSGTGWRMSLMRTCVRGLSAGMAIAIAGCQTQLMPTPNIYASGEYELYPADLDPALRSSEIELLYFTDRAPEQGKDGRLEYGWGRSRSGVFGSFVVEIGHDVDWDTLMVNSTGRKRSPKLPLTVKSITELGRFPESPSPLVLEDGRLFEDPAFTARRIEVAEIARQEIRRRLEATSSKRVFLYIHGFNNTFDYSASVLAEFYHFGGRAGVPILYTWPAASPGLQGYTHDRESGEFTIFHLKQFLRALGQMPEIERVDIIAHSRGTDVVSSALRELLIEFRAAGVDPQATLKLGNVVLASPDLDFDVVTQRLAAERMFMLFDHLTIYVSSKDKALGLADWLFGSRVRLGKVKPEDLSEIDRAILGRNDKLDIIDARVKTGFLGHSYYHSSPAVSSDLLLLLRYGFEAGSPERPLREAIPNYWILDDGDYPFVDGE